MKTGVILARFQPIHNGHLQLIKKACDENEQVLVIIGSIDKLSKRNPIPWTIRKQLVEKVGMERGCGSSSKSRHTSKAILFRRCSHFLNRQKTLF